jgi:hypothetical protein
MNKHLVESGRAFPVREGNVIFLHFLFNLFAGTGAGDEGLAGIRRAVKDAAQRIEPGGLELGGEIDYGFRIFLPVQTRLVSQEKDEIMTGIGVLSIIKLVFGQLRVHDKSVLHPENGAEAFQSGDLINMVTGRGHLGEFHGVKPLDEIVYPGGGYLPAINPAAQTTDKTGVFKDRSATKYNTILSTHNITSNLSLIKL